jgi:hypothetical protein
MVVEDDFSTSSNEITHDQSRIKINGSARTAAMRRQMRQLWDGYARGGRYNNARGVAIFWFNFLKAANHSSFQKRSTQ